MKLTGVILCVINCTNRLNNTVVKCSFQNCGIPSPNLQPRSHKFFLDKSTWELSHNWSFGWCKVYNYFKFEQCCRMNSLLKICKHSELKSDWNVAFLNVAETSSSVIQYQLMVFYRFHSVTIGPKVNFVTDL